MKNLFKRSLVLLTLLPALAFGVPKGEDAKSTIVKLDTSNHLEMHEFFLKEARKHRKSGEFEAAVAAEGLAWDHYDLIPEGKRPVVVTEDTFGEYDPHWSQENSRYSYPGY